MKKRFKRIYIEITNVCNLNCSFCSKDHYVKKSITLSQMEHILKEIDPYCDYVYLHIKGEPLVHPKIIEILDLCHQYHKYVQLVSNGTFLYQYGKQIKKHPAIRKFSISLHSLEEQPNPLEYMNQVMDFLDLPSSHVEIDLRFWNKQYIASSLLMKKMIERLSKRYDKDIIEMMKTTNRMTLDEHVHLNFDIQFVWPSLTNEYISDEGICYGSRSMIGILVNGDVVPCCLDSDGAIVLGNIYDASLSSILKEERYQKMKTKMEQRKLVEELCQKCGYCRRFK